MFDTPHIEQGRAGVAPAMHEPSHLAEGGFKAQFSARARPASGGPDCDDARPGRRDDRIAAGSLK
jgi:hypothetical protein